MESYELTELVSSFAYAAAGLLLFGIGYYFGIRKGRHAWPPFDDDVWITRRSDLSTTFIPRKEK